MRWNYYKLRQLSLLQSAMDSYYKLRQLFYYKVRHGLLQIATGITKCDDYYKLRQYRCLSTPTKPPEKKKQQHLPLGDSVPAQRNEEEVQENKSSGHNSVTVAVSDVQTTSQALTEVENKRHF